MTKFDAKLDEAEYHNLLESMPDGIVMIDSSGQIIITNKQAEQLFGYERGEMQSMSIEQLLPERFRKSHVGHRANYFQQPRIREMGAGLELYGLRRNGEEFPVAISLSPIETEHGTLALSAIRDITDSKRFERELQEKNIELANANRAKDNFLAGMSHELRTPLNAIIGFTGTLLMKLPGPLTADQQKQLQTVQSSARHLLALINDLLDLAKIEAGKIELKFEPVECDQLIQEITDSLRPLVEQKGLQLLHTTQVHGLIVNADRRALRQIIINLLNNAIKFTEQGNIRIEIDQHSGVERKTTRIIITDTGIGIRDEDRDRLFNAFTQVDATTRKLQEGTGLGLHISQKLAGLLGGVISCESEYGKGSVFTLELKE